MRSRWLFVIALLFVSFSTVATADTLLVVSGGSNGGNLPISTSVLSTGVYGQWLGISFTLGQTYTNVSITPTIGYYTQFGDFSGTAWLVTSLPTSAAPVASSAFALNSGNGAPAPLTLLSGLTLGPGTYFFLLTGNPGNSGYSGEAIWPNLVGSTLTTAPGVTAGTISFVAGSGFDLNYPPNAGWYTYPPGNALNVPIEITGSPVPEPSTLLLLGTGLAGLWLKRRRRN